MGHWVVITIKEDETDLVSEAWKTKEYEKYVLSKKYHHATDYLGLAYTNPTLENIKITYGVINDYVCSIPLKKELKKKRDEFLEELDKIGLVLHGDLSNPEVQNAVSNYKLKIITERKQSRSYQKISNLPMLLIALRSVLVEAGDYAVMCGLRISLSKKTKHGMEKVLDEEGLKMDEDI